MAFSFIPTFAELSSSFVVICKATVFKHRGEVQANSCFLFLTVCCITQSITIIEKRNKKPDMQQPCLTPVIKEKGAVTLYLVVLNRKALKTSYRALTILISFLGGIPYFSISGHQVECFLKVHKMDVHDTCSIPLTGLLQDVIENKDLMKCNQYRIVFC